MEKTEAVNKLKKAGYQVQFDSSVVTVILEKGANITQEIKKLKSFLQEIGYDASFGVKQMRDDVSVGVDKQLKDDNTLKEEKTVTVEVGEQFSLEDFGIS